MAEFGDGNEAEDDGCIRFNGGDMKIADLLAGTTWKPEDVDLIDDDYDDEVDSDLDEQEKEDSGHTVEANLELIKLNEVSLEEALEKRPPCIETLRNEMTIDVTEDGHVRKKILQEGTGVQVPPDAKVWFHYAAYHQDSKKPYDSTVGRRPHSCKLEPPGEIIKGLRHALKTMRVFETAQFVVHYDYAYGELGCTPRVPEKSTLLFNIKMVAFMSVDTLTITQLSHEERNALPFADIFKAAKECRAKGNDELANCGDLPAAIRSYRSGINFLTEYSTTNEKDNHSRCEMLCALYTNMAKSYLRLRRPEPCCVACKNGLELKIQSHKASLLLTFARAKIQLQAYDQALGLLARAKTMGKQEKCERSERKIRALQAKKKKDEEEMCRRMLGLL